MLDQITTTINGLVTIRAFRAKNHFLKDFHRFQDNHTTSYVMCFSASRAFGTDIHDLNMKNEFLNYTF
jgi:hypothetical protein